MSRIRFLHTADWQLGMRRHFLTEEALPRYRQARIDAIRTIGEIAEEQRCAFIVVAGDVFESNQIDPRTLRLTLEALDAIPVPVYLLPAVEVVPGRRTAAGRPVGKGGRPADDPHTADRLQGPTA